MPNYGNWEDSLVQHGTLKFFNDINLHFEDKTTIYKDWALLVLKGSTAIYGGGGSWCRFWNRGEFYVTRLRKRFKVIVLTSTYDSSYSIPNAVFFRRDRFESQKNMPQSLFFMTWRSSLERTLSTIAAQAPVLETFSELMRRKVSTSEQRGSQPAWSSTQGCRGVFSAINDYSVIHTDRLHVSIAGCLLGKKVHLPGSAYFKNRAAYHSSMQGFFENIHFHESHGH